MSEPAVSIKEAANVLRQVIAGQLQLVCTDGKGSWSSSYCGNINFKAGDWTFIFFNDCDELDYIDTVIAPDGRKAEFDDWCVGDFIGCPLNDLTYGEHAQLEDILYTT